MRPFLSSWLCAFSSPAWCWSLCMEVNCERRVQAASVQVRSWAVVCLADTTFRRPGSRSPLLPKLRLSPDSLLCLFLSCWHFLDRAALPCGCGLVLSRLLLGFIF